MIDKNNARVLKRIKNGAKELPPTFVGMEFARNVKEGRGFDAPFAWSVYISHDPCHDPLPHVRYDRNTVIAFARMSGEFRIIGRELDRKYALRLANGEV